MLKLDLHIEKNCLNCLKIIYHINIYFLDFNILYFEIHISVGSFQVCKPAKIAARLRCGVPIQNLRAHYNSQFCVSFHFCFHQESPRHL